MPKSSEPLSFEEKVNRERLRRRVKPSPPPLKGSDDLLFFGGLAFLLLCLAASGYGLQ